MRASLNKLARKLSNPVLNQAQPDDTKERDDERGHECKRHLSPDTTTKLTVLEVSPGVKSNECHCASGKPTGEVMVGSFHSFMCYLVANDAHEVDELNAPPPHGCLGHVSGKVPLDKINGLTENAPIGVKCH